MASLSSFVLRDCIRLTIYDDVALTSMSTFVSTHYVMIPHAQVSLTANRFSKRCLYEGGYQRGGLHIYYLPLV